MKELENVMSQLEKETKTKEQTENKIKQLRQKNSRKSIQAQAVIRWRKKAYRQRKYQPRNQISKQDIKRNCKTNKSLNEMDKEFNER